MLKDILIISGLLCAIAAVVILLVTLLRAPEGREDEMGFHYLKGRTPVSRPPFAAKGTRIRAKKDDSRARHQIPAA